MFKKEDVQIFTYWDGEKMQCTDPLEVHMHLSASNPDFVGDFKILFDLVQQQKSLDAAKDLEDIGRSMFRIPKPGWDEEKQTTVGLTCLGVIRVLVDFVVWVEGVKKNIDDMPTMQHDTETPESQSTTNVGAGSISISIE